MVQRRHIRIGLYFVLIAFCAFGSTLLSQILFGKRFVDYMWLAKCMLVMCSVILMTSAFLSRSRQKWSEFGVSLSKQSAARLFYGLVGGICVASLWTLVVYLNAHFHFERNPDFSPWAALVSLVATVGIGIGEEVGYRTFATREIFAVAGILPSLLLPTLIFVSVHLLGGMPLMAGILVVGTSSILYGALMLVTRSLPLVAAFHIANNLVQDTLLRTSSASLLAPQYEHNVQNFAVDLRIWIGMALVNVAVALVLLRQLDTRRSKQVWAAS